jgi:hypothetical protein
VRIGRREGPQAFQVALELAAEGERVEALIGVGERGVRLRGQHATGTEALVRRLRPIVDAVDPSPVPGLVHEFLDGLEEVHVQARQGVDAAELGIGGLGGEAIIPDEAAHDGAVLLLDVGTSFFLSARLRVKVMCIRWQ